LGQANTTELPSKSGSRAALSVQKLITDDIMYSDIITFEKTVNTQLLVFNNIMNYGTNHPNYRFKVILDDSEDYEKNAIIIREAVSAGIPLIKSEVYEKLGLTPPQDGDDILQTTAGY
jgi:phage gp29-like protein